MAAAAGRALGAIIRPMTMLALALLAVSHPTAAHAAQDSSGDRLFAQRWVDEDYRVAARRPEGGYLYPPAVAGMPGTGGVMRVVGPGFDGVLLCYPRTDAGPEPILAFVSGALQRFAPDDPTFEFRLLGEDESATLLGLEGRSMRLMDERPDDPYVLECRIVEREGLLYHFEVGGAVSEVGEDGRGFGPFFGAFELTEGEVRPRTAPVTPADHGGPGFVVRDGVLESGTLGLRIAPPEGWRTASRPEAVYWGFRSQALFLSPMNEAKLLVETAAFPGQGSRPAEGAEVLRAKVLGQEVAFHEVMRGRLLALGGFLRATDGSREEARFGPIVPASEAGRWLPPIEAALGSASALSDERCAEIIAATTGASDLQRDMTADAWLRDGVYTSGAHGLRWPLAGGVWTVLLEPARRYGFDRASLMVAHDHGVGLAFELLARRTASKNLERAHSRGLRRQFDRPKDEIGELPVEAIEWLGRPALRTALADRFGIGTIEFTTTLVDGHAIHASSTGMPGLMDRAAEVRGAVSAVGVPAAGRVDGEGAFIDPRMGFVLDVAGPGWSRMDLDRADGPLETRVRYRDEDGVRVQVIARWVDPVDELRDPVEARIEARMDAVAQLVRVSDAVERGQGAVIDGTRYPSFVGRSGDVRWETLIVGRGPILYEVSAWHIADREGATSLAPDIAAAAKRVRWVE